MVHDRLERSTSLPDVERRVPGGDRLEVGADEAIDVVADSRGQLGRVLHDEAGPAVERAPDPEGGGEPVPALDRPVARAEQPERRPRAGRQHQVAGEGGPVPAQQPDGLLLGHAGPQAGQQAAHAVGGLAGGPLEIGQLLDLVDDAQTVGRVDQQVAGVLDQPRRAGQPAELVHEEGGRLELRPVGVRLPADHADPAAGADPLGGEDVAQRPRPVPGLVRQAQVLEQVASHRERRRAGHPVALVADEDGRLIGRAQDEDRLLEPRIEPGQPGQVGAVLSIGVDDDPVVAARLGPLAESLEPGGVEGRGNLGHRCRHPEVGQVDRRQACPVTCMLLPARASRSRRPRRRRRFAPLDGHELVGPERDPRARPRRRATGRGPRPGRPRRVPKWIQPSCPLA